MNGVDVSNNNGDPAKVDLTGVEFIIAKSTESTTFVDGTFIQYEQIAASLNVPFGAYHFAHPDQHLPVDEANAFIAATTGHWGTIRPALDFETRGNTNPLAIMGVTRAGKWIDEFCDRVSQIVQRDPYFYSFRNYADQLLPVISNRWGLWLASRSGKAGSYKTYQGVEVAIEQWGIAGGVDRDVSYVPLLAPTPVSEGKEEEMFMFRFDSDHQHYLFFGSGWLHVNDDDAQRIVASGVPFIDHISEHWRATMVAKFGQPIG